MTRTHFRYPTTTLAALMAACGFAHADSPETPTPQEPEAIEIQVGKDEYELPALGAPAGSKAEAPPIHDDTLAAIQRWRAFAWDADEEEYRYRFAVSPTTSAALVLTPDASADELAGHLDRAATLLGEILGEEALHHDSVAIVCPSPEELTRAVDFAAAVALARGDLSAADRAYVDGAWRQQAKGQPTFFLPHAGVTGSVEGHSEKWDPRHEIVRGYGQTVVTRFAPHLAHCNPIAVGLSWNVEFDVLGDLLSVPYLEGFQYDLGRGKWSASTISKVLRDVAKRVAEEEDRAPTLADLPYLGRGDGLPEEGASVAWAVMRHLARHHTEHLPDMLTAVSERVPEIHTVVHGDGSTTYNLPPNYPLPWSEVWAQARAARVDCDWQHVHDCIARRCNHCRDWAKQRDLHR